MPDPLVNVIEENLREQFHTADVGCPLQLSGNEKGDDQRVQAARESPRNLLGETAIMFLAMRENRHSLRETKSKSLPGRLLRSSAPQKPVRRPSIAVAEIPPCPVAP